MLRWFAAGIIVWFLFVAAAGIWKAKVQREFARRSGDGAPPEEQRQRLRWRVMQTDAAVVAALVFGYFLAIGLLAIGFLVVAGS